MNTIHIQRLRAAGSSWALALLFIPLVLVSLSSFGLSQHAFATTAPEQIFAGNRTLYRGLKGPDVLALQQFLIAQKLLPSDSATGFFGAVTEQAVQRWQIQQGIVQGGTPNSTGFGAVGPLTRASMNLESQTPQSDTVFVAPARTLSRGLRGPDVVALQQFLIAQNLLSSDSGTGFFGVLTEQAVQRWQAQQGIVRSGTPNSTGFGVVGRVTRSRMISSGMNTGDISNTSISQGFMPQPNTSPTQTTDSGNSSGGGGGSAGNSVITSPNNPSTPSGTPEGTSHGENYTPDPVPPLSPPVTPPPPLSAINLSVMDTVVPYNSSTTLTWFASYDDTASCTVVGGGLSFSTLSGITSTGNLTGATTYTLNCVRVNGQSSSKSITVLVRTQPRAPTCALTVPRMVETNATYQISWRTVGVDSISLALSSNALVTWAASTTMGSMQPGQSLPVALPMPSLPTSSLSLIAPSIPSEILYTMQVSGPGGAGSCSRVIEFGKLTPVAPPSFTPSTGEYKSPATVTLSSSNASKIQYTLDGSNPTCTRGLVYTTPFALFRATTVKAVACNVLGRASVVANATYDFNQCGYNDVLASLKSFAEANRGTSELRCWDRNAIFTDPLNGTRDNPRFDIINLPATGVWKDADESTFTGYPTTITYGQIISAAAAAKFKQAGPEVGGVKKFAMIWGNRCSPIDSTPASDCVGWNSKVQRFNLGTAQAPEMYTTFFTTVAKADACTKAQTLAIVGASLPRIQQILQTEHMILATSSAAFTAPAAKLDTEAKRRTWAGSKYGMYTSAAALPYNEGKWVENVCYVPAAPGGPAEGVATHISGLLFDWEVSDKRTANQTATFFESIIPEIRQINPRLKILISTDPPDGSGAHSGVDSGSGPRLLKVFDGVPIFVRPIAQTGAQCGNRDITVQQQLDRQMAYWTPNPTAEDKQKFMVQYDFTNDENLAKETRAALFANGFRYVIVQAPYLQQWSCDVSDAANMTRTSYARHMKDLFNLPNPLIRATAAEHTSSSWWEAILDKVRELLVAAVAKVVPVFE